MARTKIICTIGPSSQRREVIREMIQEGMSVARLNFSHGSHQEHRRMMTMIREVSEELNLPVAILQDLCGPKIRVGSIPEPGIRLEPGEKFILTNQPVEGSRKRVSVSYPELPADVRQGDRILLADGMMELLVEETSATDIHCTVVTGGVLSSHKGINLPTGTLKTRALTDKDREDLEFGLANDVDYVALSFVRSADDIQELKTLIKQAGKDTPVIAKIEKHEALENIQAIMARCDGIMVARGDLGVEIPLERVPGIQKMLVRQANKAGKPVIIATQMLRSMVNALRPTRAEATDVANAVLDGADAVMLSEESASGDFPVQSVRFMAQIIRHAEENFAHEQFMELTPVKDVAEAVCHSACALSANLKAVAIVATTRSGFTAKQVSRFRPRTRILALSPEPRTVRQLALYWGCIPRLVPETRDTDERMEKAVQSARDTGMLAPDDLVVITAGHPVWVEGTTNMLQVRRL